MSVGPTSMLNDIIQTYQFVVVVEGLEVGLKVLKRALSVGLSFVPSAHADVSTDTVSVV